MDTSKLCWLTGFAAGGHVLAVLVDFVGHNNS